MDELTENITNNDMKKIIQLFNNITNNINKIITLLNTFQDSSYTIDKILLIKYIIINYHSQLNSNQINDLLKIFPKESEIDDTILLILFRFDLDDKHFTDIIDKYTGSYSDFYNLWKTEFSIKDWILNYIFDDDEPCLEMILNDLDIILKNICKYKGNLDIILPLICSQSFTENHLLLIDKYNYIWFTEYYFLHYISHHIFNIEGEIYDEDCTEILKPDFINIMNLFAKRGINLTLDIIINIFNKKYNDYYFNYCTHYILKKFIISVINSDLFPQNKYSITDENYKDLFKCNSDIIINIFNKCKYEYSDKHIEFLITQDINVQEQIKIIQFLINKYNIELTASMLETSIKLKNISLTTFFLENKIPPKEEYIYKYLEEKSIEIIKILILYGLHISPKLYTFLKMRYLSDIDKFLVFDDNKLKESTDLIINCNILNKTKKKKIKEIKNMDHLVELYRSYSKSDIFNIVNISKKKFVPDKTCFRMALLNPDTKVLYHIIDNYNFVPTIFDIITIPNIELRYEMLQRFYPEYAVIS
jgi:hypothetical protein